MADRTIHRLEGKQGGFHSHVVIGQPYTGEYFDEFVLPVLARKQDRQSVLILGFGLGSAVQPLLDTGLVSSITGVDLSETSLQKGMQLFDEYIDSGLLNLRHEDAETFLRKAETQYDVIWVDLYTDESYAACVKNRIFFESLKGVLKEGGVVAVNIYSVPFCLHRYSERTPLD